MERLTSKAFAASLSLASLPEVKMVIIAAARGRGDDRRAASVCLPADAKGRHRLKDANFDLAQPTSNRVLSFAR
jgi:hypothetical protein